MELSTEERREVEVGESDINEVKWEVDEVREGRTWEWGESSGGRGEVRGERISSMMVEDKTSSIFPLVVQAGSSRTTQAAVPGTVYLPHNCSSNQPPIIVCWPVYPKQWETH